MGEYVIIISEMVSCTDFCQKQIVCTYSNNYTIISYN